MAQRRERYRLDKGKKTDWNSLPVDLLHLIANKLSAVEDFVALTCVSSYFRSSLKKDQWRPLDELSQPPWLLLGRRDTRSNSKTTAGSMYNKNFFDMDLPELRGRHCWGTPYGLIITTLGYNKDVYLFNPLNRRHVALPPPERSSENLSPCVNRERPKHRAMLIKRPPFGFDHFMVVFIGYYGSLGVLRPQENTWEIVSLSGGGMPAGMDIAYCNGQIYVVDALARVTICSNLDGPGPLTVVEYVAEVDYKIYGRAANLYFLESQGDLLLVSRRIDSKKSKKPSSTGFDVFKLNHQTKEWIEVVDLGDRSLFVGDCQSISLSSPRAFNCKTNCIYFIEYYDPRPLHDEKVKINLGVYDLKTRAVRPFSGSLARFTTATWFVPTLT